MSAKAQKFHSRAPRYVLESAEGRTMRFASMTSKGRALATELTDVSETGLAFEISAGETPHLTLASSLEEGDMLKVEFTPPGSKPIACFATVIRIEPKSTWHPDLGERLSTKVAVHFRNLPLAYLKALQQSFGKLTPHDMIETAHARRFSVSTFIAAVGVLCAFLYAMSLPSAFWHSLF